MRRRDGLTGGAVAALILLQSALSNSTVGAQFHGPVFLPPPAIAPAPTPLPLAPPVNPGPAPAPPPSLSPLLTQPGPVLRIPERAAPTYPNTQYPGPIDQQKLRSYRSRLLEEERQRDRAGVSPDTPRSREIQRQLNQPGNSP